MTQLELVKGTISGEKWLRKFETSVDSVKCGHCGRVIVSGGLVFVCPGGQVFCECDLDKGKDDYDKARLCSRLKFGLGVGCVHQRAYLSVVKRKAGDLLDDLSLVDDDEVEE